MINKIKTFVKNPLFGGSAVMILGTNIANVVAYLYHLIIGRMLGPSNYGELAAVLSVLGLLYTSFNFLGLVIVKFVSAAKESEVYTIIEWFKKRTIYIAFVFAFLLLMSTKPLSQFLHISQNTTLLIPPIVLVAFLTFVYRSFAQGLIKFFSVALSTNIEMIFRLAGGVILIILGYGVFGTVVGIFIGTLLSFLYLRSYVGKNVTKNGNRSFKLGKKVLTYSFPILIATLTTNSIFSTDVILVKHFFNSHDAGIYASLSTLAKIIFYGTGPVSAVMFPLIAKRHSENKNSSKIFLLSLVFTAAIVLAVTFIYYLLPELSIKILFGDKYLEGSTYLFVFSIFISLFSVSSLIFNFFLSIEKTKVVFISLIASFVQIVGILIWHNNLLNVLRVNIVSALFLLLALSLYYLYYIKSYVKNS